MSKVSKMMVDALQGVGCTCSSASSRPPPPSHVCWGPPRQCLPGLRGEQIDHKKCQHDPIVITRELHEDHSGLYFWTNLNTLRSSQFSSLENQ